MKIIVARSGRDFVLTAADIISAHLSDVTTPVIGLATGDTFTDVYRELVARYRDGRLSFAKTRALLLDEYAGIAAHHPQRFRNVICAELIDRTDLTADALHSPDGNAKDLQQECARYDRLIADAGVGLQLLGIGQNGHIAFNEPGTSFSSGTHVARLTAETRRDNARFFPSPPEVPRYALTQSSGTILMASELAMLARGKSKARAIRQAIGGPVDTSVPASALQLHAKVTVIMDREAATELA